MAEQRIDLNTASVEELAQLPGIGPVLARRVVTYRETVHPYDEPADITAVSGIGQQGYRAIADRLTVTRPAEDVPAAPDASPDQREEDLTSDPFEAEEEPQAEPELELEERIPSEEEMGLDVRAAPPGESVSEEPLPLEEETSREEEEVSPVEPEATTEPPKEAELEPDQEPGEEGPGEPQKEAVQEEPPQEEPAQDEPAEYGFPPSTLATPVETAPPSPWWRRLSWLWTAILGGLLGMIFSLVVWAGVNGSLDVGHSWAVLDLESEVDGLATDVGAIGSEVEGLQKRLDALEGLKDRVEQVESSVDNLREETTELRDQADAMEREIAAMAEELQTLSEDVQMLQEQAERTETFFGGLQVLLNDVFGEMEVEMMPTPTPTPEGK
jgi:competence ComEA-like helix-hairpin-helix protein